MIKSITTIALLSLGLLAYGADSSQNIRLTNDQQTLEVNLPANATTGYQWYVQSYDHELLSLQDYRYVAPNTKLMGAGGTALFSFNIDPSFYSAPQTTTISFIYQRPWSPGQNTSSATVTVLATESNNDNTAWQKYPATPSAATPTATPMPASSSHNNSPANWISLPANSTSSQS